MDLQDKKANRRTPRGNHDTASLCLEKKKLSRPYEMTAKVKTAVNSSDSHDSKFKLNCRFIMPKK